MSTCLALRVTDAASWGGSCTRRRVRCVALGPARRGRQGPRAGAGRILRDRLAPGGEGIPGVGIRTSRRRKTRSRPASISRSPRERTSSAGGARGEARTGGANTPRVPRPGRSAGESGNEPVFADGEIVPRVTSGGIGYAVYRSIAFAYLPAALAEPGIRLETEVFGGEWAHRGLPPADLGPGRRADQGRGRNRGATSFDIGGQVALVTGASRGMGTMSTALWLPVPASSPSLARSTTSRRSWRRRATKGATRPAS